MSRSRFSRPSSLKTSFNVGSIVPFYVDEVLPGDTFNVKTSRVVRLQTLLTPVMDNIYLDSYFFFVPNRLVWDHWKQFNGENTESAWIPQTEYEVPQITAPDGGWQIGSIADYMGIPTGVDNISVNALPLRAYALIMNEWFRDQNLSDPVVVPTDDSTVQGSNGSTFVTDLAKGGIPYTAAKFRDYFSSSLPAPQKGEDVKVNIANEGLYPLTTGAFYAPATNSSGGVNAATYGSAANTTSTMYYQFGSNNTIGGLGFDPANGNPVGLAPTNLYADISEGNAITINQLRLAFQIQKLYERDARGGTRYIEILKSHFGVTSPDARLQRPEYLGGNRVPININQIIQQSATVDGSTPQGTTVGQSLTVDQHNDFTKSFTEHGFVIGVMVARYDHTYQQGIERFWSRKSRFDYYWPVFANIGEQAVYNKEIYAQGTDQDDEVFGYQEAWADYRYKPSRVTGEMRSAAPQSLDVWHLADDYDTLPKLSDAWIREDPNNVDRVLAVQSENSNQLFADIFINNVCTRAMPMYSIPGLIDHH